MTPQSFLWLAGFSLIGSSMSAAASQSLHQLGVHELEEYCRRRQRSAWFDLIVEWRESMTIGAESLRVVCTVLAICSSISWLTGPGADETLSVWLGDVVGITLAVLVFNSWIPYAISQINAAGYIFHTWRIWWLVAILTWPLIAGTRVVSDIFQRAAGVVEDEDGEEEWLEDEIRSIVSEGERDGLLESDERDMIEGVMELDEKDVFSVMTPRSRVDLLDGNTEWAQAVEFVVRSGRTRIPVYTGRVDDIVGILFAKDLLRESLLPVAERRSLPELVRPALNVPESIFLNEMLQKFLREHTHLAVVRDEYGAFSGIVTIEDILEEIVGDIVDETDQEHPLKMLELEDGVFLVDGLVRVDEVNENQGWEIPEDEDFDTVAGWLMHRSRQIPRVNSIWRFDGLEIQVTRASRRMIEEVQLRSLSDEERELETVASELELPDPAQNKIGDSPTAASGA